ncbi:hypothetical protein J3P88_16590 [Pseudomonas sp. Z3-6]|uniref:hypothetical protein n=1 Tax=Pseudomonas sp. Z3-6 TaxID=2817411 RepID=UPI003DA9A833
MKYVLTFPRHLHLYESAWGIHVRILLVNDINLVQYYRLVGSSAAGKSLRRVNWFSSKEFNLDLFSYALGISEKEARTAFVDLAFGSPMHHAVNQVRHCSVCSEQLFHSTWFLFPWIEKCPIHSLTLQPCKTCSTALTPTGVIRLQSKEYFCMHLNLYRGEKFPQPKLDEVSARLWDQWNQQITSWIDKVTQVSRLHLLEVARTSTAHWSSRPLFIYWRYLETLVGESPIDINFPKVVVARIRLFKMLDKADSSGNLVACAKALRRHIFSRYVKKHKRCHNQIKRFGVSSCSSILGERRCSCVLGYYTWLVTFLNVYTMADLNSAKFNPYAPDSQFYRNVVGLDLRTFLLRGWMSFHAAWSTVEFCTDNFSGANIILIHIRIERGADFFRPPYTFFLRAPGSDVEDGYYISSASLAVRSKKRCCLRGAKGMIHSGAPNDVGYANLRREEFLVLFFPNAAARSSSETFYI